MNAQACRILVCLMDEKLIPYFTAQVRFRKLNHTGRLAWLANGMFYCFYAGCEYSHRCV